ncbi:MAG: SsrA-binding protein SmpB [Nitrospinae bacterium]|nr:SsrA-binding protein SmpB [Nitrospinota bacterium]
MGTDKKAIKIVVTNKKAYHNYHIEETVEAGIVLLGTEVKSLRDGNVQMADAYAFPRRGEMYLEKLHIAEYKHGNLQNHEPLRSRKLLLHRREMEKLMAKAEEKGYTILPLKIYFKGDYAKVELGLGRGKKLYDKRETLKAKAMERDMNRQVRIKH